MSRPKYRTLGKKEFKTKAFRLKFTQEFQVTRTSNNCVIGFKYQIALNIKQTKIKGQRNKACANHKGKAKRKRKLQRSTMVENANHKGKVN